MPYCPGCGAQINPNWRTCAHCGTPLAAPGTSRANATAYAPWLSRAGAVLIDVVVGGALAIVARLLGHVVSESLGATLYLVVAFGFAIWNSILRQGSTGQTIGKTLVDISVVREDTLRPIGYGLALARNLIPSAITVITFGLFGVLDYLWPLWDDRNQRITDKILSTVVISGLPSGE